jgi:hypothetical protein
MDEQIDELKRVITKVLADALPGVEVDFDPYPGYGKLHPVVVWDGFEDKPFLERQHNVWDLLRPQLSEEQRLATGFLLLASHAEVNAMEPVAA